MIVYQPAFDIYHTVYRMIQLLTRFARNDSVEVERLRIWDFYVLFPNKMKEIKTTNAEKDVKELIAQFIERKENPYEFIADSRIVFERMRSCQMTAIKCLASYGLINKNYLELNRVTIIDHKALKNYAEKFETLSTQEHNAISLLTSHFYLVPLYGKNGLKNKTNLLESKYDAQ